MSALSCTWIFLVCTHHQIMNECLVCRLTDTSCLVSAVTFALIASAETLLSANAVDSMHKGQPADLTKVPRTIVHYPVPYPHYCALYPVSFHCLAHDISDHHKARVQITCALPIPQGSSVLQCPVSCLIAQYGNKNSPEHIHTLLVFKSPKPWGAGLSG